MDDKDDNDEFNFDGQSDFFNPFEAMFGMSVGTGESDEIELAQRMMEAGRTMEDAVEYMQENDIDIEEDAADAIHDNDESVENKSFFFGFMAMSGGIQDLSEELGEDDDDSNPFRVDDDDGPIR